LAPDRGDEPDEDAMVAGRTLFLIAALLATRAAKKPEPPPPPPPPVPPDKNVGAPITPALITEIAEGRMRLNSFVRSSGGDAEGKARVSSTVLVEPTAAPKVEGEAPQMTRVRVDDCASFFEAIRAKGEARIVGDDAWPVTLDLGRMRNGDAVILDAARGDCLGGSELLDDPAAACTKGGRCATDFLVAPTVLLSVVGPFVT
jgi:hypothetical protein